MINAGIAERLELVDLKSDYGFGRDATLAVWRRGKQLTLNNATIDKALTQLNALLSRHSDNVQLVVPRAAHNIGHARLTMGEN